MFGRECARILRARSCSTRLVFPSNQYCWVLGDIRAASPIYNENSISASRAIHNVGLAVKSQILPELELPKLASDADLFFNMMMTERRFQPSVLLLMEKAMNVPTSTQDSEQCLDSSPLVFSFGHQSIHAIAEMSNIYYHVRHNMLDDGDTRYHPSSLKFVLDIKLSVLLGDFMLSKIFVILASTENSEVQSILSRVIEHLVLGQAMEMTSSSQQLCSIANYLEMVYNKKASLLANSCKAIAILSGKDEEVTTMAFDYGKYLVYAYQLMDDIADITGRSATSGNLSSNFSRGMLGSPMLYAIEEFPQLRTFVDRGFKNPSELDLALEYLKKSRGMQRTRELATKYAGLALEAIESLPRSNNKDTEVWRRALVDLAQNIIRSSQVSKDICWV
nr:PREDICTED: solanesyl-diphosphate synthase 1, mitochondrial-like isoform X2 [Daucus carota subsp. sativus]